MHFLALLFLLPLCSCFEIILQSPRQTVSPGGNLTLACKSDGHYEYCVWRHKSQICEYEWKSSEGKVLKQRCSKELTNRLKFSGSYTSHECAIFLQDVTAEDAGQWSCEMEDYVWGPARGSTHKKNLEVEVKNEGDEDEEEEEDSDFIPIVFEPENTSESPNDTSDSNEQEATGRTIDTASSTTDSTTTLDYSSGTTDSFEIVTQIIDESDQDTSDESVELDNDILDHFHNLSTEINKGEDAWEQKPEGQPRNADSIDIESEEDATPYVGIILGSFGALFVIMVLVVFVLYRHKRKTLAEEDWRERKERIISEQNNEGGEVNNGTTKLELSNILEDQDDLEVNPGDVRVEIDVNTQKMTYHGSRTVSYDEEERPISNRNN